VAEIRSARGAHRIVGEVRCRLNMSVAEQFADDRQALDGGESHGSEAVP
jgi:hypothetical protein